MFIRRLLPATLVACAVLFALPALAQTAPATCDPSLANNYVCNTSTDGSSIAIGGAGEPATVAGSYSTVVGSLSSATGTNASVFGAMSTAGGDDASVFGSQAYATTSATAVGAYSSAQASQSVAVGEYAFTDTASQGAVAIGDGVSVGGSPYSVTMGQGAMANGASQSVTVGAFTYNQGANSIAVGAQSNVDPLSNDSVVMGTQAGAAGNAASSVVIGSQAYASGTPTATANMSIVVGAQAHTIANSTAVFGAGAYTDSDSATAIGMDAHAGDPVNYPAGTGADGNYYGTSIGAQTALGSQANAVGGQSVAVGAQATVDQDAQFGAAFGYGAHAEASNCLALGSGATCTRQNSVEFGYGLGTGEGLRVLGGVAQGYLSTDAVNVGQLSGVTSFLGGGAGLDAQGNPISPMYVLTNPYTAGDYSTVGDAISALDKAIGEVQSTPGPQGPAGANGSNGAQGPAGPQGPQGPAGKDGTGNGSGDDPLAVHYDSKKLNSVTLGRQPNTNDNQTADAVGGPVAVHNLADGTAPNDAVNVSQLDEALSSANQYTDIKSTQVLTQANQYTDMQVGRLNVRINYALAAAAAGANAAAAVAGQDPAHKNRMAIADGLASGVNAWTVMYQHKNDNGMTWNVSVTGEQGGGSSAERQVGVGIGYSW